MKWIMMMGVLCALWAGCENQDGAGTRGGTLTGTAWRLTSWSASSPDPSAFTITADFSDSRISGSAAVNAYGGAYTITSAGGFSAGALSSTLMAGSEEAMRAESTYLDLLRQASAYELSSKSLTLQDGNHHTILTFQAR